jgi:hypothetical protein
MIPEFPQLDIADYIQANQNLARKIDAALEHHNPEYDPAVGEICAECSCGDHRFIYWPCPTVEALQGQPL